MTKLENENILKLIFEGFRSTKVAQASNKILNKTLSTTIFKIINYEKLFKLLGESTTILDDHKDWIFSLSLLEDNLISISADKTLKVWDINNLKCIRTVEDEYYIKSAVIFSSYVITCIWTGKIKIWDSQNDFKCVQEISFTGYDCFTSLLLMRNGCLGLTANFKDDKNQNNKCILILNILDNYSLSKVLYGHTNYITCLVNLLGNKFASGSEDETIKIWDGGDGNGYSCIKTLTEHKHWIFSLLFFERLNLLVSGSRENYIKIWRMDDYDCIQTVFNDGGVRSLLLLTGGYFAAGSYYKKVITIWDIKSYECIKTLKGHRDSVCSLLLLKDFRLISSSYDKKIIIYDY
jgi:WD40 repeat protein